MDALKEKYYKTSKLTGTIKIIPNKEEVREIEKLLRNGKYLKEDTLNIIKISDIDKALLKSKYQDYSLKDILFKIYGYIITKDEERTSLKESNEDIYQTFLESYQGTLVFTILKDMPYNELINLINKERYLLDNISYSLNNLPFSKTPLSIFASNMTKNPHYFDLDTKNGNMFLKFLSMFLNTGIPKKRSDKIKLLNEVNITTDNYSNFIMTYNLYGEDYLNILSMKKEVINLNLNNILNIKELYSKNKKVIILENPSVLEYITSLNTDCGIIIGGGNPNIALYELLSKFKNHQFYYNGDYDPEGLLIADKLKKQYDLNLFLYDKELFKRIKSGSKISDARIKKLDHVTSDELNEIKNLIKLTKEVGYQEKIIDEIIEFIKKC